MGLKVINSFLLFISIPKFLIAANFLMQGAELCIIFTTIFLVSFNCRLQLFLQGREIYHKF